MFLLLVSLYYHCTTVLYRTHDTPHNPIDPRLDMFVTRTESHRHSAHYDHNILHSIALHIAFLFVLSARRHRLISCLSPRPYYFLNIDLGHLINHGSGGDNSLLSSLATLEEAAG